MSADRPVVLYDTTLRDGTQGEGVTFSVTDKLRVAERLDLEVEGVMSGPLGGDQQIGAMIATGEIDILIFFWDPMEAQPHDPDIKALLRVAVTWNLPFACDRATADFMLTSPLMQDDYTCIVPDYTEYVKRKI